MSRCSSVDTLDTTYSTCTFSSVATDSTMNLATTPLSKKYLFRAAVNIQPLMEILEKVSVRIDEDKWFQFDISAFRKMVFQNIHQPFLNVVKDYYYPAKWRKYGNKELTYNSFTTILRQLCNEVGRTFYTKHVYDHSVCNTVYFISAQTKVPQSESEIVELLPPAPLYGREHEECPEGSATPLIYGGKGQCRPPGPVPSFCPILSTTSLISENTCTMPSPTDLMRDGCASRCESSMSIPFF